MDFIALSLLKLSAACITGESTPSIKSDSIFVLQNHGLTTKAVKGFKTGKFDKRIKGLLTSLHERALTISCLFSTTSNVFSQPNPLQSLSLLCWAPTHRPTGSYFSKRPRVWGHWELNMIQRWRAEGMVLFRSFFIYFARLVAIIGGSNTTNNISYLFKQF